MSSRAKMFMEKRFNRKMQLMMKKNSTGTTQSMTSREYKITIRKVIAAKKVADSLRTADQQECLREFDVVKVGGKNKLITPLQDMEGPRYFLRNRELFKILHEHHMNSNHGPNDKMLEELKLKYKNITPEIIRAYVKLCRECRKKAAGATTTTTTTTASTSASTSTNEPANEEEAERRKNLTRGQVECLRMFPQGKAPSYNHLLMYHDHVNNYDVARPIKVRRTDVISKILLDIFALFGKPDILQTMKGSNFIYKVVDRIKEDSPGIEIEPEEVKVHVKHLKNLMAAKVSFSMNRDPAMLDVGEIFTSWAFQIAKPMGPKLSVVTGERRSSGSQEGTPDPYRAMFVRNLKSSRQWYHLTGNVLDRIRAENLVENRKPVVSLYNKSY